MKGLHIDAERRLAWAGAGLTAGEYTTAAAAHGLATPFGDTGSVRHRRPDPGWRHRLARAQVRPDDRCAARGRDRHRRRPHPAPPARTSTPDLFWAVRGGGGNFGIVTRFQFQLYPVERHPRWRALPAADGDVLRSLVPIAAGAPEELTTISFLMRMPPAPFVPGRAGRPAVARGHVRLRRRPGRRRGRPRAVPAGGDAAGRAGRADALPGHLRSSSRPPSSRGSRSRARGSSTRIDDDADRRDPRRDHDGPVADGDGPDPHPRRRDGPRPVRRHGVRPSGRQRSWSPCSTRSRIPTDATEQVAWTDGLHEALAPNAVGVYSNFLEREGEDRIREAYGRQTYERLSQIKRRYDPTNLFRSNQNIRPARIG